MPPTAGESDESKRKVNEYMQEQLTRDAWRAYCQAQANREWSNAKTVAKVMLEARRVERRSAHPFIVAYARETHGMGSAHLAVTLDRLVLWHRMARVLGGD